MWEIYILCLEGGLVSPKRVRNTDCEELWRFFLSTKVCHRIRTKDASRLPKNAEIGGLFEFNSSTLFKNYKSKFEKLVTYSG
jgi:hypothetical protein